VILKFSRDITEGLIALHEAKIAHRDLKPENLLLSEENGDLTLILGDFGLSKKISSMSIMKTICGTPVTFSNFSQKYFMAPEIFSDQKYGVKIDIFSLGAILYYLMTKKTRLFHIEIVKNPNLHSEMRKEMEVNYSSHLITLTLNLLSLKDKERPSALDLLQYLNDLERKKLSFIAGYIPKNVYSHSCVLYQSSMIIFGGYFETDSNNIYEFNIESIDWKDLNSKSTNFKQITPMPRSWHSAVLHEDSMYIGKYFINLK
jgi:serine/threonine protein kinase